MLKNNDPVAEARLRVKYQGLVFFDPDNQTIHSVSLEIWSIAKEGMVGGV